jgi:integrase/recombinase XerD
LLEVAPALLEYIAAAGIKDDLEEPLFRLLTYDRRTFQRKYLKRQDIRETVKKYARAVGTNADRVERRGVGGHALRKTAITNALQNGAPIEKAQQPAGHSDIRIRSSITSHQLKTRGTRHHIQIRCRPRTEG